MRRVLEIAFTVTVILFITGSLAGFLLGRPVFLSYAYSGSMTPTIDKGDLFLVNPFARNYDVGDIIVFHRSDGWTVHRIFAVTDEGFLTKGDNNVATDQQNGQYPPVKVDEIAGKVIVVAGHPLVIRGGGTFIESARKRLTNVYAIGLLLAIGAILTFSGGSKNRRRRKKRFVRIPLRSVYGLLSVFIIAGFLFVTVASWGTLAFSYSSTLAGGQRDGWYLPGSTFEQNLSVENRAVYPFYYFLSQKSSNVEFLDRTEFALPGRGTGEVMLRVHVPNETRVYSEEVTVRSYPAILPFSLVSALYALNPYLPLVAYAVEIGLVLLAFYYLAGLEKGDVVRFRVRRGSIIGKIIGDG
jgi:signal peptidase